MGNGAHTLEGLEVFKPILWFSHALPKIISKGLSTKSIKASTSNPYVLWQTRFKCEWDILKMLDMCVWMSV